MDQVFKPEPKRTKRSKVGFPCNKCEYVATRTSYLKVHIESKHDGVRYPCSQCEYAATTARYLRVHVENKH